MQCTYHYTNPTCGDNVCRGTTDRLMWSHTYLVGMAGFEPAKSRFLAVHVYQFHHTPIYDCSCQRGYQPKRFFPTSKKSFKTQRRVLSFTSSFIDDNGSLVDYRYFTLALILRVLSNVLGTSLAMLLVGDAGFEPTASASQAQPSTKLA